MQLRFFANPKTSSSQLLSDSFFFFSCSVEKKRPFCLQNFALAFCLIFLFAQFCQVCLESFLFAFDFSVLFRRFPLFAFHQNYDV